MTNIPSAGSTSNSSSSVTRMRWEKKELEDRNDINSSIWEQIYIYIYIYIYYIFTIMVSHTTR